MVVEGQDRYCLSKPPSGLTLPFNPLSPAIETSVSLATPFAKRQIWRDRRVWRWLPAAGALLFGWLCLWNKLRIDWTINEQYEYGWFVPPLTLALLALRWKDRPEPRPIAPPFGSLLAVGVLLGLLLLLPVRLVEGPNPDWRSVYWLHAAVLVGLSFAWVLWSGGWGWVRHFAVPILFLLVAIPWPSEFEQSVVQSLMRGVAAIASECMAVLGVPAIAQGNVISVRGQLVGVNEACSGIRSLQTTLMASLFLGELSRFDVIRRVALLAGGVVIAFMANVFRSSLLVWIAAQSGLAALEHYHDATGIIVLFTVFGALLWLNAILARGRRQADTGAEPARARSPVTPVPRWIVLAAVLWLAAVEIGNVLWYGGPGAEQLVMLPRWSVVPPVDAPGFKTLPIDERTTRLLRYDHGLSIHWTREQGEDIQDDCTLFYFRWEPGHASSLQADMHQPHICLTASGLRETADWGIHPLTLPDGITLPVRRYEFDFHGRLLYVFFVVWKDGTSGAEGQAEQPGSRAARLRAVLERRSLVGRQTLEFLVTGPATPEEADALFTSEIHSLVHRDG